MKALTAIELDLDRCVEVYNRAPCLAAREGDFVPDLNYVFRDTNNGFAATSGTFVSAADDSLYTQTGADPMLRTPAGLSIVGATSPIIRIDVERTANRSSGSWQGDIYYTNGGHGESGSFFQNFDEPLLGQRVTLEIDMSSLAAGTTDWLGGTTTQVRFDFDSAGSGAFKIYSVQFGHYATADEATGTHKCFNALASCQDRVHFNNDPITQRFSRPTADFPRSIEALPYVSSVRYSPAVISLGKDLGQRASLDVMFADHPHADTGVNGDPYPESRDYDPFTTGTFWGKFRARQRYLRGRPLRWMQGLVGQALVNWDTRHFFMESFNGPTLDGSFSITSKDVLKLLDGDRAQAPAASKGSLTSALNTTDWLGTLAPAGIGATYPVSGWGNIGGKEIVTFARDATLGLDANTLLLLHFDGADGATTTVDSSASNRTVTFNGNAQLDTGLKKFGPSSLLLDGTGDYVTVPDDAAWAFGTNAFTIDCQINCDTLAAQRTVWSQQTDANNRWRLFVTTAGALTFEIVSASVTTVTMTSSNGVIAADTTYHVAVTRTGNVFNIWVNGTSVATVTDADSVPNFTGAFTIGMTSTTTDPFFGWIDEFRISNVARWTSAFTAPIAPFMELVDDIYIVRAQYNTEAQDHAAGDRFQLCLRYNAQDPADIIYDLCVTYGQIPAIYINLSDWQAETAAYYRRLNSTLIAEPTSVKLLVSELIEQDALAIWWDESEQKIQLRVLRAISTDAQTFSDEDHIVRGSIKVTEQPDKRISQVWTYFGQFNPLKSVSDKDNYRSYAISDDLDEEENYGQPSIKKIFSRWIPFGGLTAAERVNDIQIGRFRTPPRLIELELFRRGQVTPLLGNGYQLSSKNLQTLQGKRDIVPTQIISLNPGDDRWSVKFEEQLFVDLGDQDDLTHYITIDADSHNLNFRTIHDSLYAAPVKGDVVSITVNQNIIVGSTSVGSFAADVGSWPTEAVTGNRSSGNPVLSSLTVDPIAAGWLPGMHVTGTGIPVGAKILTVDSTSQITLDMNASSGSGTATALTIWTVRVSLYLRGRIQGKGGNGGQGSTTFAAGADGSPGQNGGWALYCRSAIDLDLSTGDAEIWAGGGGGGGASVGYFNYGNGGGGGAGFDPGSGGLVGGLTGSGSEGTNGAPGTTEVGGDGGAATGYGSPVPQWDGGDGGDPGQAGTQGGSYGGGRDGGAGGSAGGAIDGLSFIKKISTGSILGSEIN